MASAATIDVEFRMRRVWPFRLACWLRSGRLAERAIPWIVVETRVKGRKWERSHLEVRRV